MDAKRMLVVVTDVDASLIDHDTYSFEAALDAIRGLARLSVPLVLCSSKTRAELLHLQGALGIEHPFISENGGALHVPARCFPFEIPGCSRTNGGPLELPLGRPYASVVGVLHRTAAVLGVRVTGFSDMTCEQVAAECGLSLPLAMLAKQREYDEPFRAVDGDESMRARLHAALRDAGIRVVAGARYDHAGGGVGKGAAVSLLRRFYQKAAGDVVLAGLGDGLNDVSLLQAVDVPVIVRSATSATTARLQKAVPSAVVTRAPGPTGWGDAVLELLARAS